MKGEKQTNIVFGKGVFKVDGELIGLTRDGGTFIVEFNNRIINADGDRGIVKGRVVREEAKAKIEINHLELLTAFDKLHPAVKVDTESESGYTVLTGTGELAEKDYHQVSFEGETKDGREVIIEISNAINLDNMSLELKDKNDIVDKVAFAATYDPAAEDEMNECWKIKYKTASV